MKTKNYVWGGTMALAAFFAVPPMATAQVRGSFVRPGTQAAPTATSSPVIQAVPAAPVNQSNQSNAFVRPAPAPSFTPMRSGVIERGSRPNYNDNNNYSLPNPGVRQGPVVVLPEAPVPFPHPNYSTSTSIYSSNDNRVNNSGPSYSRPTRSRPNYLPPVGPANGFFNNQTPPIGPANGFGQNTPAPERRHRPGWNGGNNYVYGPPPTSYPVIVNAPPLLGGYYYGGYCESYAPAESYPSVYSVYSGFPQYIYGPGVIVVGQPYVPVYATPYLPFYTPVYQTIYNENTYYVGSQSRVDELQAGGDRAKAALRNAYPANSFQAAFADIARAWTDGDITLLRRHLRDKETRLSVSLNKKYSYSIASGDFADITRDALDRLQTVSFDFTRLRKAKNGDVTAYGTHIYRVAEDITTSNSTSGSSTSGDDGTVPFDQSGADANASPYNQSNDPSNGAEKTVYVSYTLRRHEGEWYLTAIDSSDHPLVGDSK